MKNLIEDVPVMQADMAWDSKMRPKKIFFRHITPERISQAILAIVSKYIPEIDRGKMATLRSLRPIRDPAGHFCLQYGKKKWFLRITRRKRKNSGLEDAVALYLSNVGIKVNLPVITNLRVYWKNHNYLLYIFPFIEGRHYDGSDSDLKSLSTVLAKVHNALRSFKFANQIYANALKTAEHLAGVKEMLAYSLRFNDFSMYYELFGWMQRHRNWLKTMAEHFDPYLCLSPHAQCVHGELHLGNVIYSLNDGSVILTDFEEVADAWFPPAFDLSYLVHRFCMDRLRSKKIFHKRLNIVETYYGPLPPNLKQIMLQVCWYNIALIISRCICRESIVPEEENEKFIRLENLTNTWL